MLASSAKRHEKNCQKNFKNDSKVNENQEETLEADTNQENLFERFPNKITFKESNIRCRFCGCGPFTLESSAKRHEKRYCKKNIKIETNHQINQVDIDTQIKTESQNFNTENTENPTLLTSGFNLQPESFMPDLVQNQIFTPNIMDNQFEEPPQQVVQTPNNSYLMNSYGNINVPQTPHYDPYGILGSLNSLAPLPLATTQTYSQNSLNYSANTEYEENDIQTLTSTPKIPSVPTLQIFPKLASKISPEPTPKVSLEPIPTISSAPTLRMFPMPTSKISPEPTPNLSLEPIPKISSSAIAQVSPVSNPNIAPLSTNPKLTPIVEVKCKDTFAFMDTKKFVSGGIGNCIQLGEEWLTPNEFEKRSGSRAKKYLTSIKCLGHPLRFFVDNGELNSSGMKRVHKKIVPKTIQPNSLPPVPLHIQTPIKIPNIYPDTPQTEEGIEGIVIETQSTLQTMANSETMPEDLFHLEPKAKSKVINSDNQAENGSEILDEKNLRNQPKDQEECKTMSKSDASLEAMSVTTG